MKKGQVKQSIQLVKPRDYSESEGMILKWISLLDLHYRAGLSAQEKLSYVAALREYNAKRLDESFSIAMKECEFLPRAADIVKRLPVERPRAYEDGGFVSVKEYAEGGMRIWEDSAGHRRARIIGAR